MDKISYALGLGIGQQIKSMNIENFSIEDFTKSISDVLQGKETAFSSREAQIMLQEYFQKKQREEAQGNIAAGKAYLDANAKKEGVKTLPSGVQYKVIKEGNGPMPKDTSMVEVNYEGRTIDGKVFDSSYQRKQPLPLRANQVIKGWTEALTMMPVGSVWEIYVPQELAYGEREQGPIKPFSTLIFKIELLNIK